MPRSITASSRPISPDPNPRPASPARPRPAARNSDIMQTMHSIFSSGQADIGPLKPTRPPMPRGRTSERAAADKASSVRSRPEIGPRRPTANQSALAGAIMGEHTFGMMRPMGESSPEASPTKNKKFFPWGAKHDEPNKSSTGAVDEQAAPANAKAPDSDWFLTHLRPILARGKSAINGPTLGARQDRPDGEERPSLEPQ